MTPEEKKEKIRIKALMIGMFILGFALGLFTFTLLNAGVN